MMAGLTTLFAGTGQGTTPPVDGSSDPGAGTSPIEDPNDPGSGSDGSFGTQDFGTQGFGGADPSAPGAESLTGYALDGSGTDHSLDGDGLGG